MSSLLGGGAGANGNGANGGHHPPSGACLLSPWIRDAACELLASGREDVNATNTPATANGRGGGTWRGRGGSGSPSGRPKIVQVLSSSNSLPPSGPFRSNSNGMGRCRSCPPYLVVHDGRTASAVFFSHPVRSDLFHSSASGAAADDMSTTAQMHRARMDLARKRGTVIRLNTWYVSTVAHSTGSHFKHLGNSGLGGPLCLFVEGGVALLGCGGGALATDGELVDVNDDVRVRALLQAPRISGGDAGKDTDGNDADGTKGTTTTTAMDHWELIKRVGAARRRYYHRDGVDREGGDDDDYDDEPPPLLAPPPDASGAVVSTNALALFDVDVSGVGCGGVVGILPPLGGGDGEGDGDGDGDGVEGDGNDENDGASANGGGDGRRRDSGGDGVGPSSFVSELEAADADADADAASPARALTADASSYDDDPDDDDDEGGGGRGGDGGIPGIDQVLAASSSSSDDDTNDPSEGADGDGDGDGGGEEGDEEGGGAALLETQEGGERSREAEGGGLAEDPAARVAVEKSGESDSADSDATSLGDYHSPRPADGGRSYLDLDAATDPRSPVHRPHLQESRRGGGVGGVGTNRFGGGGGIGPSSLVSELEAADGSAADAEDAGASSSASNDPPPDEDDEEDAGDSPQEGGDDSDKGDDDEKDASDSPPGGEDNNGNDGIKKEDDDDSDEEKKDASDDPPGGAHDDDDDDDDDDDGDGGDEKEDDYRPNEDEEDEEEDLEVDEDEEDDKDDETVDYASVRSGSDEDSDDDRDELLEEFVATADLSTFEFAELWLVMSDRLRWRAAAGRFHVPYRARWPEGAGDAVDDAISAARMRCVGSPSGRILAPSSSGFAGGSNRGVVTSFDSHDAVIWFLNSGRPQLWRRRRQRRRQKRRRRGSKKKTPSADDSPWDDMDDDDEDLSPSQTLARFLRDDVLRAYYAKHSADKNDRPDASTTNAGAAQDDNYRRNDAAPVQNSAGRIRRDSRLGTVSAGVGGSTTHSTKTLVATNRRTSFGKGIRTRRRRKNMFTPPPVAEEETRNASAASQRPPPSSRDTQDGRGPMALGPNDGAEGGRSSPSGRKRPPAAIALPGDKLRRAVAANRSKKRKRRSNEQKGKYFSLGAWMSKNLRK